MIERLPKKYVLFSIWIILQWKNEFNIYFSSYSFKHSPVSMRSSLSETQRGWKFHDQPRCTHTMIVCATSVRIYLLLNQTYLPLTLWWSKVIGKKDVQKFTTKEMLIHWKLKFVYFHFFKSRSLRYFSDHLVHVDSNIQRIV